MATDGNMWHDYREARQGTGDKQQPCQLCATPSVCVRVCVCVDTDVGCGVWVQTWGVGEDVGCGVWGVGVMD